MKVKLARSAGFCMGVRRAMEIVLSEVNNGEGPLYTLGPLIHNRQVLELLEKKGVRAIDNPNGITRGTIVIRAHGIPPRQRKCLRSSGLKIIDATCPKVAKVQAIIRYHTAKGYEAIIVGEKDHAEVIGLKGYSSDSAFIIADPTDVSKLPDLGKPFVVAQTTQNERLYQDITRRLKDRFPMCLVFNTICDATQNRQNEVRSFSGQVDGLVVVGGYHSGNTRRLVQVAESQGVPTFHVETEKELDKKQLSSMETVGITAGASTPNWMIKNVIKEIEGIRSRKETALGQWIRKSLKFLLLSNGLVAFGALSLSFAVPLLVGRKSDLRYSLLAFFYVYAMHVVNRFLDKGASTYNDPERANFHKKHRLFLALSCLLSFIGALTYAYYLGRYLLLAMAGLCFFGVIYSIPIIPMGLRFFGGYEKIKDIPGSKNVSEGLAWGAVITLLPLLEQQRPEWLPTVLSFFFVFSMVYTRSAIFDVFQVQGDMIVGSETLPISLGERRTLILLKLMMVIAIGAMIITAASGLISSFAYLLLFCFLSLFLCLIIYEKKWLYPGNRFEALVEGSLILSGLLGLLWELT